MIFYLTAILNGFLNTINKMVNVKAGEVLGTTTGALVNYIEASILSFCLIFAVGRGGELSLSHILSVPPLFYLGSICGLLAMLLLILGTARSGAMLSTVLILVGQLSASVVLDYVFFEEFSLLKIAGIFCILMGIAWKERMKESERRQKIKAPL